MRFLVRYRLILWAVFGVLAVGAFLGLRKSVFSVVDLQLTMDRDQALNAAREHAKEHGWGPPRYQQGAWFSGGGNAKAFFELKGGRDKLVELVEQGAFTPARWCVRHFEESEKREGTVCFTPSGDFYSLNEILPETWEGATISGEDAEALAREALEEAGHDLSIYALHAQRESEQPSGRTDHYIVFRRTDLEVFEAHFDVSTRVAGDRVNRISPFVDLPEHWSGEYQRMRSRNQTLAVPGGLWFIFGSTMTSLMVLAFLGRKHPIRWRVPVLLGALIGISQMANVANGFPMLGQDYDTALSWGAATALFWAQLPSVGLLILFWLTLALSAADLLLRVGFPEHLDLWQLHKPEVHGSREFWGLAVAGLATIGPLLVYVLTFYGMASTTFGWWYPTSMDSPAGGVATAIPALAPICSALMAGFSEEWMFRAIPIGLAAVVGKRFGRPMLWIGAAVLLQALVFGTAHATYPQQPAYARVVELFLPWVVMGFVFVRFGIIPCIVAHFYFDLFLMAGPLFEAEAPGLGLQRALVIAVFAVPYLGLAGLALRRGGFVALPDSGTYGGWVPAEVGAIDVGEVRRPTSIPRSILGLAGALALVAVGEPFLPGKGTTHSIPIEMRRGEALALAREAVEARGVDLSDWDTVASITCRSPGSAHRFAYETGGDDLLQQLASVSNGVTCSPRWRVRFLRFGHESVERWAVYIRPLDGGIQTNIWHTLPEDDPGASLDEEEARTLAIRHLDEAMGVKADELEERSFRSIERENRLDWSFTFVHTGFDLGDGDARFKATLRGDDVESSNWVRRPDEWTRQRRRDANTLEILKIPRTLSLVGFLAASIALGTLVVVRGRFAWRPFVGLTAVFVAIVVADAALRWNQMLYGFDYQEPVMAQVFQSLAPSLLMGVLSSVMLAFPATAILALRPRSVSFPPAWLTGLVLGAALAGVAGIHTVVDLMANGPPLRWMNYSDATSVVPEISIALRGASDYLGAVCVVGMAAAAADYLSAGWTRRRGVYFALAVLAWIAMNGASSVEGWLNLVVTGIVFATFLVTVVRTQFAAVATMAAVPQLVVLLTLLYQRPYPGATVGAILGILTVGALSAATCRALETVGPGGAVVGPRASSDTRTPGEEGG